MRNAEFYRGTRPGTNHSSLWHVLSNVDTFFDNAMKVSDTGPEESEPSKIAYTPRANVEETKEAYVIEFDLPGVKREDLKVDVYGRTLTLTGERKRESAAEKTGLQRYECASGPFERSFTLPEGVDAAKVDAILRDGVLRVTVPKAEELKPRTIEIKAL